MAFITTKICVQLERGFMVLINLGVDVINLAHKLQIVYC